MEKDSNETLCGLIINKLKSNKNLKYEVGKSVKSGNDFFKIWDDSWFYKNKKYSIHFEGDLSSVKLHFETYPYTPYSKLSEEVRFFIDEKKKVIIPLVAKAKIKDQQIKVMNIRKNAVLTVGSYSIEANNFGDYFKSLMSLIEDVSIVLKDLTL